MLKKIMTAALSGVMLMTSVQFGSLSVNAMAEASMGNIVYVSINGREDATGTMADPFDSIETARDYLREKGTVTEDNRGIIYLREGVYHINKSIALTEDDSYVTYTAFGDEKVEITGSANLERGGFKKLSEAEGEKYSSKSRIKESVADKIYVYDLGEAGIPVGDIYKNGFNWTKKPLQPELVVNGELQTLAQYPDNGSFITTSNMGIANKGSEPRNYFFDKTDNVKTYEEMLAMSAPVFTIKNLPASAQKWAAPYGDGSTYSSVTGDMSETNPYSDNTKYETDGWFSGYYANEYANDNLKIYSVRLSGGAYYLYCKYPSIYSVNNSLKVTAINLLCELDTEGEYYIDRYNGNNVLYYYPKNDEIVDVTLTSLDTPLVTITNAKDIYISGISFTGTTSHGITLTDCENCRIDNCELYNISMDAIRMGDNNGMITCDPEYDTFGGGHNNTVVNCVIHDMGHGGVYVAGGERKSLERGNNTVENCEFYNFSRLATYTPAVYLEGVGNTAKNNYIHDAPHMVIQLMGNDMLVTGNKIVNACYNANDMAPIYVGRDWSWLGNEISYNYIENVRYTDATNFNFGIYMDDNASGVIIRNNIFNKIGGNGVYLNKGFGSYVVDNIFIDSTGPYYRYLTGGDTSWARPIPNEKALKYRFFDMLRTEEAAIASGDENKDATKGYWNSEENISYWVEHYNELYNNLEEYSTNPEHAFDLSKMYFPAEGDKSSNVWLDKNAVITQNHNTVARNITVNTADLWIKSGLYNNTHVSDSAIFDTKRHRASTAKALGLNLESGKISNESSLMSDANYGEAWIEKWNATYSMENAGVGEVVDNTKLFVKIEEAEGIENKSDALVSALAVSHAVASDRFAKQSDVDEAYKLLFAALAEITPQYELNFYKAELVMGETLQLTVTGDNAQDALWYSSDESVAIVDREGIVYPSAEGNCIITVQIGSKELECAVTVKKVAVDRKIAIDATKATVTSQESNNPGKHAVDGQAATRWAAAYVVSNPYPQSITIDLGKEYDVEQIDISFYYTGTAKDKDRAYSYVIWGKGESGNWEELLDKRDNTDRTSDVTLDIEDKNSSRYIKFEAYGSDKGGLAALSIYEISLYERGATVSYREVLEKEINAAENIDKEKCDKALIEELNAAIENAESVLASSDNEEELRSAYDMLRKTMLKLEKRVEYLACGNDVVSCFVPQGIKGQLICAIYDGDSMSKVKTYPVTTEEGEVFSAPFIDIPHGSKVKIMLWDDMTKLEPVLEYVNV